MSQHTRSRLSALPERSAFDAVGCGDMKGDEWLEAIDDIEVRRYELNVLIMDYLISEGFKEAAERFKKEAGVDMKRLTETINQAAKGESSAAMEKRIQIRCSIEDGRIPEAMKLMNDYYPELIDNNRHLYFKLQQQQLIELIRGQHIEESLKFAQEQLSVDGDYLQLPELERTLSLLAFDKPESSPYSDLLHSSHRQQLASEVNEVILKEESGDAELSKPRLITLLKLLLWTQSELERKKIKFPKISDLATATILGSSE